MKNNTAIEVIGLSKTYSLYSKPMDRFKEALNLFPGRKKMHSNFYALQDVNFSIGRGETVGIIGTNGSGKSTLLKMITGVLTPTSGVLNVNGNVSALLELGAGFNPEHTGIENVYLSGAIMGYTKDQIDSKMEHIISFADIGEHIFQPVKTYSSGMFARLAFSVAINVDPDIFIVDEALSVGDMFFQDKSFTKMKEFRKQGKTILFVSHSLPSVRNFCDRAIWIEKGRLMMDGESSIVCAAYQEYMSSEDAMTQPEVSNAKWNEDHKIYINSVKLDKSAYILDDDITISIGLSFNESVKGYGIGVIIYNSLGKIVTLFNTVRDDLLLKEQHGKVELRIPNNDFVEGKYFTSIIISDELSMYPYDRQDYIASFEVAAKKNKNGIPIAEGMFRSKHSWVF